VFSVDLSITLELAASRQQADTRFLEFIFQVCANMREIDMSGVVVADALPCLGHFVVSDDSLGTIPFATSH
jgi:hypothetical protein